MLKFETYYILSYDWSCCGEYWQKKTTHESPGESRKLKKHLPLRVMKPNREKLNNNQKIEMQVENPESQ